jgi:hypothetical protein
LKLLLFKLNRGAFTMNFSIFVLMISLPTKTIIGRREWASLPIFGLKKVEVKIDTGAYTSSVHVSKIEETDGLLHVVFLDAAHPEFQQITHTFSDFRKKNVKSSNGHIQERYFIRTKIILAGRILNTEFSLTERKAMRYPILIGRKTLKKRFIVDPSLKYTH